VNFGKQNRMRCKAASAPQCEHCKHRKRTGTNAATRRFWQPKTHLFLGEYLGPLWAVYDADRVPEMAAQPLTARFAACPWALYHIAVQG
jgi:hypothetical protein